MNVPWPGRALPYQKMKDDSHRRRHHDGDINKVSRKTRENPVWKKIANVKRWTTDILTHEKPLKQRDALQMALSNNNNNKEPDNRLEWLQKEIAAIEADRNQSVSQLQYVEGMQKLLSEQLYQFDEEWEAFQRELLVFNAQRAALKDKIAELDEQLLELQNEYDVEAFQHRHDASESCDKLQCLPPVDPSLTDDNIQVGDYILDKPLGEGCFGTVWQGHVKGRPAGQVALKRIEKSTLSSLSSIQQLDSEVAVLKLHPHPNVVQLVNVLHSPQHIYIVTEKAWTDLHAYHCSSAAAAGISYKSIRQVMIGVLRGLNHLHGTAVCAHLDVKPENVLLVGSTRNENGRSRIRAEQVRLCDFGFCAFIGGQNNTDNDDNDDDDDDNRRLSACIVGTPGYFAPEQVDCEYGFCGFKADMWSVGACLLELTTGFPDDWFPSYEHAACTKEPDYAAFQSGIAGCLQDIRRVELFNNDARLFDLLTRGLLVNEADRFSADRALKHPWIASRRNRGIDPEQQTKQKQNKTT